MTLDFKAKTFRAFTTVLQNPFLFTALLKKLSEFFIFHSTLLCDVLVQSFYLNKFEFGNFRARTFELRDIQRALPIGIFQTSNVGQFEICTQF